jgi:hypothetical protein
VDAAPTFRLARREFAEIADLKADARNYRGSRVADENKVGSLATAAKLEFEPKNGLGPGTLKVDDSSFFQARCFHWAVKQEGETIAQSIIRRRVLK